MTDPYRRFSVTLREHTGALVLWLQRSFTVTGTLEQCEQAYRKAQLHCLLAGWWGLVSLFLMNPIALISNYSAIRRVRTAAGQTPTPSAGTPYPPVSSAMAPAATYVPRPAGPPPGWYPNQTGSGQRYWDGVTWTHWTHPR